MLEHEKRSPRSEMCNIVMEAHTKQKLDDVSLKVTARFLS